MSQKKITQDARRAELATQARSGKRGLDEVRALANGDDEDAFLARSVLAEMGGKEGQGNFPSGSSESSGMKDGGMAYGRGGRQYQHNYATGGSVMDHLSKGKKVMSNCKMAKGGSVKGKTHYYAAGGMVQDQLSKVTGHPSNMMGGKQQIDRRMPESVQAMTALPGETPAQRSKRLREGG